jgi:Arc/MetJ-type ribon-helix-helix transcriptional regulator
MPLVHLRIPQDIEERIQALVDGGKFKTKSEVIRTALIEWLSWREMKVLYDEKKTVE